MKTCNGKTLQGKKCKLNAKYPLQNPKYCHLHKNQMKGG